MRGDDTVGAWRERIRETYALRIDRWQLGSTESTSVTRPRWYMMLFPHQGAFVVHSAESAAVIDLNMVLLAPPEAPLWISRGRGAPARGACLSIRPEVFQAMWHHRSPQDGHDKVLCVPLRIPTRASSVLLERMLYRLAAARAMVTTREVDALGVSLVASCVSLVRSADELAVNVRNNILVETLKTILSERLTLGRPRLDQLAAAVKVSPSHVCRLFKRATGISPQRYQRSLRVRAALSGVMDPSGDLCEVALRFGFASHSHFSAVFRREFGVSPSEVRQATQEARLAGDRRIP